MSNAQHPVRAALEQAKVIDPHCHLRLDKPAADSLADIVLYHHVWIELVSSGMDRFEVSEPGLPHEMVDAGIDPLERVRRALPYLANIRNTTVGVYLKRLLRDLYGIEALTELNLEDAFRRVEEKGRSPEWQEHLLRDLCGIECNISVEPGPAPYAPKMLPAREVFPANLISGKQTSQQILSQWETSFGREISNARDYAEFLGQTLSTVPLGELQFLGWWVVPWITNETPTEVDVTRILRRVKVGRPLEPEEIGGFCRYGMTVMLEALRQTSLRTIQLIVGAEVLLPHRAITQWSGGFSGAMGRIACQFEDFHFSMSTASDAYTQDLGILAKHIANISVAGYWWHTLYPFYIRKSLETRLDMVPLGKIVAYFSDAYHAEWCYPKLKMVKEILGDILVERVERGWYDTDTAIDIAHAVLYDNPKRIYGA